MMLEDGFRWIIYGAADGVPTEMDYISSEWTHTQIASEYLRRCVRAS